MADESRGEKLFDRFLATIDFVLIKHPDGWSVEDLQGANLGDIEGDRFSSAALLIDRLDSYIQDYFISDIEEELEGAGIDAGGLNAPDLLRLAREKAPTGWKEYHQFELDVLDMILNHAGEIDLEKCNFSDNTGQGYPQGQPYVPGNLEGLPPEIRAATEEAQRQHYAAYRRVEDYLFSKYESQRPCLRDIPGAYTKK